MKILSYTQCLEKCAMPDEVLKALLYGLRYRNKFPKKGKYRLEKLQAIISTHGFASFQYAHRVLNAEFPMGEESISDCTVSSYLYAVNVCKRRFYYGEKSILLSPWHAYNYANEVIKDRWPEAEEMLLASEYRDNYLRSFKHKGIKV